MTPSSTQTSAVKTRRFAALAGIAVIYFVLVLCTTAEYVGDTPVYVSDIVIFNSQVFHGYPNPLWEFGHLFWRPLGWILFTWFGWLVPYNGAGQETLAVTAVLDALSMLSGLICALLFYVLALRLLRHRGWATLVAAGFVSFAAFLDYVHAGTPYITGLAGLLGALWVTLRSIDKGKPSWQFGLLGGACFAIAVLFWFPYVVVLPGILAAALLWESERGAGSVGFEDRFRLTVYLSISAVCFIGIGYLIAVLQLHIGSLTELRAWFASASHGWSQGKRIVRLATGVPRSFLYTGDDGLALKRYFLRDPYARVSLADLIRNHLWKMMIFYLAVLLLAWSLWRSVQGRRILSICLAAVLPLIAFAVFAFETGSPERYLPLYPFVCLAVACILSSSLASARSRILIAAFFVLTISMNVLAFWKPGVEARVAREAARVESLQTRVSPTGMVALVSLADSIYTFSAQRPFNPTNRRGKLPVYDVVVLANVRVVTWKHDFAKRALDTLNRSENVWISKRFLAEAPNPAWGWSEGDDPRISWKQLPPFFRQFSYSESVGGSDGFLKLEPSDSNLRKLREVAAI